MAKRWQLNACFVGGLESVNGGISATVIGGPVIVGGPIASDEQVLERFTELSGHTAVDGEVDGVRQADEEVGKQNEDVDQSVVEDFELQTAVEDVQDGDDGQWYLHGQEHGHHHDQHQRGTVGVTQLATFALFLVLLEEFVARLLRLSQGAEQQHVQHHQRETGQ